MFFFPAQTLFYRERVEEVSGWRWDPFAVGGQVDAEIGVTIRSSFWHTRGLTETLVGQLSGAHEIQLSFHFLLKKCDNIHTYTDSPSVLLDVWNIIFRGTAGWVSGSLFQTWKQYWWREVLFDNKKGWFIRRYLWQWQSHIWWSSPENEKSIGEEDEKGEKSKKKSSHHLLHLLAWLWLW